jgi:hypothetical protein
VTGAVEAVVEGAAFAQKESISYLCRVTGGLHRRAGFYK